MGTETRCHIQKLKFYTIEMVKLNNPLMGTETIKNTESDIAGIKAES